MTSVRFITTYAETCEPKIRSTWTRLLDQCPDETVFYQSTAYFDHLASYARDHNPLLAVVEDNDTLLGVAPLKLDEISLDFRASRMRLGGASYPCVRLLGGRLLFPASPDTLDVFFRCLAEAFPQRAAIELPGLSLASPIWTYLSQRRSTLGDFLIYAPDGTRPYHTLRLPASFTDYLGAFTRKKRYNLKRQVRRLEEFAAKRLVLRKIDSPDAIPEFERALEDVAATRGSERLTRNMGTHEMQRLAERGLLHCYALAAGGRYCAVAYGTRFNGTLLLHSFAYDKRIEQLSPGTVLQVLMVQDLIEGKRMRRIDYGFGDPRYRMTNKVEQRVTAVMIRKNVGTRVAVATHASFSTLVDCTKRLTRWSSHETSSS